jgi:hypothetical protein
MEVWASAMYTCLLEVWLVAIMHSVNLQKNNLCKYELVQSYENACSKQYAKQYVPQMACHVVYGLGLVKRIVWATLFDMHIFANACVDVDCLSFVLVLRAVWVGELVHWFWLHGHMQTMCSTMQYI